MPGPLVGPLVGAGIGFLGSLFGGRPKVAGIDPLTDQAQSNWQNIIGYGNTGFGALSGDPEAVRRMMNPYNETLNPFWDMLRQRSLSTAGSQATLQGAYGGDRHALVEGSALADVANAQAAQRYGEFENAMGRAGQLASFGYGANSKLDELARYRREVRQQQLTGKYRNPFGAAIGGAMIGGGLFPGSGIPGAPNTGGYVPDPALLTLPPCPPGLPGC